MTFDGLSGTICCLIALMQLQPSERVQIGPLLLQVEQRLALVCAEQYGLSTLFSCSEAEGCGRRGWCNLLAGSQGGSTGFVTKEGW